MKQIFDKITLKTKGPGLYDFTQQTKNFVNKNKNFFVRGNLLNTPKTQNSTLKLLLSFYLLQ